MLQRDKENREIRKLGRERLKEIRNRLLETGIDAKRIHTSVVYIFILASSLPELSTQVMSTVILYISI